MKKFPCSQTASNRSFIALDEAIFLILLTVAVVYIAIPMFDFSNQKIETPETEKIQLISKPACINIQYSETTILRQKSWRDKRFLENVHVQHAYEISEGDMNFVLTVEAESKFDPQAVGDNGNSRWFCQWHYKWHKETRNNPNFNDPVWQMEECFKYYTQVLNNGTINSRLYWYKVRNLMKDRFIFKAEEKTLQICE